MHLYIGQGHLQAVSGETDIRSRDFSLTIEVMQTLVVLVSKTGFKMYVSTDPRSTYKVPNKKRIMRMIFCLVGT